MSYDLDHIPESFFYGGVDGNSSPLQTPSLKIYNTTNERCNCLHPVIILNPSIKDLIATHRNYTYRGKFRNVKDGRLYPHFEVLFGSKPSEEDIDDCYVTDLSTGELFPMYLLVPCGHCEICKSTKIEAFAHRCLLETQMYDYRPWFITLTYSDKYLPEDGVRVDHCQDFFKRLRSRFDYYGIDYKIRYVCCSEYGSNTYREHYHILIWNLPNWKFWKVKNQVKKCWKKGIVYVSQVSDTYIVKGTGHCLSKPEKCFEYVAKYMCKDGFVPEGKNRTFLTTSKRNGGIGAPFLDWHAAYIRRQRRWSFEFVDKFSQEKRKLVYSRYVFNRLFPSKYQSIPLKLRKAILFVCRHAPNVSYGNVVLDKFRPLYRPHVLWSEVSAADWSKFVHLSSPPRWVHCRTCPFISRAFWMMYKVLQSYVDFDFDRAERLAESRQYVMAHLTRNKKIRYLDPIARFFRFNRDIARQRELL